MSSRWREGLISESLRAITSTLGCPRVEVRAAICRLRLVGDTVSASTRVRRPIPARARNSAAKPPTPPRPTTNTCARARRSMPRSLTSRCWRSFHCSSEFPSIFFRTANLRQKTQTSFSGKRYSSEVLSPFFPPGSVGERVLEGVFRADKRRIGEGQRKKFASDLARSLSFSTFVLD